MRARRKPKRDPRSATKRGYDLPIGTGVLDREFDDIDGAEFELRGRYGGAEDNDR